MIYEWHGTEATGSPSDMDLTVKVESQGRQLAEQERRIQELETWLWHVVLWRFKPKLELDLLNEERGLSEEVVIISGGLLFKVNHLLLKAYPPGSTPPGPSFG